MLKLDNISLNYHSKLGETHALKDLSLSVDDGEFVSIVGPSGCGKSTILNIISGLIKTSSGSVILNDQIVTKPNSKIGYIFQRDNLFEWLNILSNVKLGLSIQKKATYENVSYAKNLLIKYGLGDFTYHHPSNLSGGMRQRVALIRTLATKPEILLLDEPFSALDYQTRLNVQDDVYKIIRDEHKTAILVTHDIGEAVAMSDKIFILSKRPGTVKKIIITDFDKNLTPFERRKQQNFNTYFDEIWEELAWKVIQGNICIFCKNRDEI